MVLPSAPTAPPERLNENMPEDLELANWLTAWTKTEFGTESLRQISDQVDDRFAWLLRLRKLGLSPAQAGAVIELAELRQRARAKFSGAARLFFTRRAYEQASGETLGAWKVQCIRARWPAVPIVVLDLCCGVGGDMLQLAREFPTIGLDRDPALVHFARSNLHEVGFGADSAGVLPPTVVVEADVMSILPPLQPTEGSPDTKVGSANDVGAMDIGSRLRRLSEWIEYLPTEVQNWANQHQLLNHSVVWHLDPDRRDSRGRHTRIEDIAPNGEFLAALRRWSPGGLVKLAPGTELSEAWERAAHWQWLGMERECKQLLGLFGFDGSRSVAVYNRKRLAWELWQPDQVEKVDTASLSECEPNYLIEMHPAFYAARLAREFAVQRKWQPMRGGDYFSCQALTMDDTEQFSAFHVLEVLPLREKAITEWLRQHERGVLEIKSRSVPEATRKPLQELMRRFPHRKDQVAVSLLVFQISKGSESAIRVAICERVVANV